MMPLDSIKSFSKGSTYQLVKFPSKDNEEFGKILQGEELISFKLNENEVHRSIDCENGDVLFVFDLKPNIEEQYIDNPLQLLINNLEEAKLIESVYPSLFTWVFDGISIRAYAIVPSGCPKANSTITRYGGTDLFIKILRQHLRNIAKMHSGIAPNCNFLHTNEDIKETEICLGSLNLKNMMYSVPIKLNMSYLEILKVSKNNTQFDIELNELEMKYWAREINPDFIADTKHIKLKETLDLDMEFKLYPPCIKNIMALKDKGNLNRFKMAKFLLSVHKSQDAKFLYYAVLADEEREHVEKGNCSGQWNYVLNNISRYSCPTCRELKFFCDGQCPLTHPLETIQNELENKKNIDIQKVS